MYVQHLLAMSLVLSLSNIRNSSFYFIVFRVQLCCCVLVLIKRIMWWNFCKRKIPNDLICWYVLKHFWLHSSNPFYWTFDILKVSLSNSNLVRKVEFLLNWMRVRQREGERESKKTKANKLANWPNFRSLTKIDCLHPSTPISFKACIRYKNNKSTVIRPPEHFR